MACPDARHRALLGLYRDLVFPGSSGAQRRLANLRRARLLLIKRKRNPFMLKLRKIAAEETGRKRQHKKKKMLFFLLW